MGFLEDIVARKREEVAERSRVLPQATLDPHPRAGHHRLVESLTRDGVRLIAEVKRRSPSEGDLAADDDIVHRVHEYMAGGAAAISVLTDPIHFGGSLEDLATIRAEVALPLLRKDFVVDGYQLMEAAHAGADAVLLIVAALGEKELCDLHQQARELFLEPLVEVHSEDDLERALTLGARVIGVNSRDLRTLEVDLDTCRRLLPRIPEGCVAVAESGLKSYADVREMADAGARAFLVGSVLMHAEDPRETLRCLQGYL